MTYEHLVVLAGFTLVYSLVAGRIDRMPISGPIVFTAFGLAVGPAGLGLLDLEIDAERVRFLAEVTLALVLYTDAASTDLGVLRKSRQLPRRLLLIGLPLTILLGLAVGSVVLPGLTLIEVAILATMLAPTDAALGAAVVSDSRVPPAVREGMKVESGLNDGICVPILFVLLAVAAGGMSGSDESELALRLIVQEIGVGLVVGLLLTALVASGIRRGWNRGWITAPWRPMIVVALAFSCFALAQLLGGSGFIAAFSGGLLFGGLAGDHNEALVGAAEGIGNTLALATWVVFGAVAVGQMVAEFDWRILLYAALSLTVVRMLPVFLSLSGTGVPTRGKLFIGWFGPRGLASIVFIVIVLDKNLPGGHTMLVAVVCTVLMSILTHGFSANPTIAALSARAHARPAGTTD